ncbi:MAG: flavodoxin [Candidatus Nanoarchaeia archaeon]|nr:flavodoxin [Candidatus Nanoarchaeia archaeon]
MKILVVYYSRTGTTKTVAEEIKKELNCDIDEITDDVDRKGPIGYLLSGKEATLKQLTKIKTKKDPSKYELIIIGTPVWSFTMSTPIRSYISKYKEKFKNVAFFCTLSGSGSEKTLKDMEILSKKFTKHKLSLKTLDVKNNNYEEKLKKFIKEIHLS